MSWYHISVIVSLFGAVTWNAILVSGIDGFPPAIRIFDATVKMAYWFLIIFQRLWQNILLVKNVYFLLLNFDHSKLKQFIRIILVLLKEFKNFFLVSTYHLYYFYINTIETYKLSLLTICYRCYLSSNRLIFYNPIHL